MELFGIDVSKHQGVIDWEKVKNSGVQFAIIRCGYGTDKTANDDIQWERNASECERLGIPYGVYLYSYSDSVEKSRSEAQHVLRLVKNHKFNYPIFYDLEDKITSKCNAKLLGDMAQAFCEIINNAGYKVGIYANKYWLTSKLVDPRFNNWDKWVAQYNNTCTYNGNKVMWQYSSCGAVNGINGRVDVNKCYVDYVGQNQQINTPVINIVSDPLANKTNEELARMVINGELGNGEERKQRLGARYNDVQNAVNALLAPPKPVRKSNEEIAREVLAGKWGNGTDRKNRLTAAGYDYNTIQAIINKSAAPAPAPAKTYRTYTVKKGDSLWTIAARQLGNGSRYKEIKNLNGLRSDTIYAGQVLKLPN